MMKSRWFNPVWPFTIAACFLASSNLPRADRAAVKGSRRGDSGRLARPAGLEPATYGSVDRRSVQLSYGRAV